jgi:hypothetical protein
VKAHRVSPERRKAILGEAIGRVGPAAIGPEERALLSELRSAGFKLSSIWDWVNMPSARYAEAEPVLRGHLERSKDERLVEGIARSLTNRAFLESGPALIQRFRDVQSASARWAIGNAIATIGFRGIEDEVVGLVADPRYGTARQMLVLNLYRIRRPEVEKVLISLLGDPTVDGWAASALARCGGKGAIPSLESVDLSKSSPRGKSAIPKAAAKLRARHGAT